MDFVFFISLVVEWILGFVSKKCNIKTDLIPYQNLIVGCIVCFINFIVTHDFEGSLIVSGLFAGGVYDLFHNISKMSWYKKICNK